MPRQARIDAPGALHHIVIRGIERKPIFKDSTDYHNFLERLGNILGESSTPCFAWALMSNHIHLLMRTGLTPIATVMRRLLTGYAQQFNRRHRRHGHLFQNKTKIQAQGIGLSQLIDKVAARLEVNVGLILSASRQRTVAMARSIICCLAVDQLMLSNTFVADRLNLTPSAVSKLVSRGRLEAETRKIDIDTLSKMK